MGPLWLVTMIASAYFFLSFTLGENSPDFRSLSSNFHSRRSRIDQRHLQRRQDPQQELKLSPQALQSASNSPGKPVGPQVPSLTSPNNFINFCISTQGRAHNAVILNGAQSKNGPACNGIPMGMIPGQDNLPHCRFESPKNMDKLPPGKTFKVTLVIKNLITGSFTNPEKTFYSAPTQLDPKTLFVVGHTHIVISQVQSLSSNEILDPFKFKFFKGVDGAADKDGKVSLEVKDGLPAGIYRITSLNSASNHQPIAAPLAQRGSYDDAIYITVQ
ncbi:uncharacterized protein MELLADRAFT_124060 [Melampsora larici-populina 98AG31]|uniref:Secreted protein n=1 Tax=Melampsora larici-populina (strain 98AG31 / pathotype 3-4-7) TaxID=747676 RepID=F4RPZ5_MELLP|nr:uncharacterized protein MELLADRAFT_124060 [Melampsora larici-populina 98AG31]EGG05646.1 hypothetical protein MELLADRAFT_124060 [Melampsora larici-populina 98AG31]